MIEDNPFANIIFLTLRPSPAVVDSMFYNVKIKFATPIGIAEAKKKAAGGIPPNNSFSCRIG
ncbi:hypothetical protein [Carnobacterium iners]|uniref:hypothetical protein n=1 Tax=Carnobacterium iners TaxID=1073423 RepID=UPI000A1CD9CD|nr:hypothetical protein [Carnobacterium iners]